LIIMDLSAAADGFRLAYERTGAGIPVVLLHGWPSDRTEYREVAALLPDAAPRWPLPGGVQTWCGRWCSRRRCRASAPGS
jgi:pimeloyl-ACP methyl ester carboxylesterase